MRRLSSYRVAAIAGVTVSAMLLTACGSDSNGNTTTPGTSGSAGSSSSAAGGSGLKIGMAYDIGGRGDKSFNDSAALGLDKVALAGSLRGVSETDAAVARRLLESEVLPAMLGGGA